jgi:flagellar basal-body rod modification protein FlgD
MIDTVASTTSRSSSNTAAGSTTGASDTAASADRFLTLLVAQLENQDPLNPMDNAQVTTQMAQISTVTGIDKLNATMQAMNASTLQSQTLQGAAMVGRNVLMQGNLLSAGAKDGEHAAVFQLAGGANTVKVEFLAASGAVVGTKDLGEMDAGRHEVDWKDKPDAVEATAFRVIAKAGENKVTTTTYVRDRVDAVVTGGDGLTLELSRFGNVPFNQISIVN